MSDLRDRVVRLAYTRPDLRPHLVPMLREAYVRMPDSADAFEYEGPRATEAGDAMARLVQGSLAEVRAQDREAWESVGRVLLQLSDVDVDPATSRKVIMDAFSGVYQAAQEGARAAFRRKGSSFSFGFSGPGSEAASDRMVLALARAVREVEGRASVVRVALSRALEANVRAGLDPVPSYARTVVGLAVMDTYEEMYYEVRAYFRKLPVKGPR